MKAAIHRDMAYQVIQDQPDREIEQFLIRNVVKSSIEGAGSCSVEWLKDWMDMPDNEHHSSKQKNDHSYKLKKTSHGFRIEFIDNKYDQATVIARLKYDFRDMIEWKQVMEYRTCALVMAKSIHWVIDFNTPPHAIAGWETKEHSYIETHFSRMWKSAYDENKSQIKFGRAGKIKDIYRWAKGIIEQDYDRNNALLKLYKNKGSILKEEGNTLGKEVIMTMAQNLADYLAYCSARLNIAAIA